MIDVSIIHFMMLGIYALQFSAGLLTQFRKLPAGGNLGGESGCLCATAGVTTSVSSYGKCKSSTTVVTSTSKIT